MREREGEREGGRESGRVGEWEIESWLFSSSSPIAKTTVSQRERDCRFHLKSDTRSKLGERCARMACTT